MRVSSSGGPWCDGWVVEGEVTVDAELGAAQLISQTHRRCSRPDSSRAVAYVMLPWVRIPAQAWRRADISLAPLMGPTLPNNPVFLIKNWAGNDPSFGVPRRDQAGFVGTPDRWLCWGKGHGLTVWRSPVSRTVPEGSGCRAGVANWCPTGPDDTRDVPS